MAPLNLSGVQRAEADRLRVAAVIEDARTCMQYALIPGGTFIMGSADEGEADTPQIETPEHQVQLRTFYVSATEVTNEQFERFVLATSYVPEGGTAAQCNVIDPASGVWTVSSKASWGYPLMGGGRPADWSRRPVVLVSWNDAASYAAWAGGKLPSEAQFEFLLRAGGTRRFPWGESGFPPPGYGNYFGSEFLRAFPGTNLVPIRGWEDQFEMSAAVRSFGPDSNGIYDVSGNVWEWCLDDYVEDFYAQAAARKANPVAVGGDGVHKAVRGGAWSMSLDSLRCAYRKRYLRSTCVDDLGFRVVRSVAGA